MLCKHSFINDDGRRQCEKVNNPCRYPNAPDSEVCELAQVVTEEKARKAGQIIKKFCASQFRYYNCRECPIYDMCNTPPHTWEDKDDI